MTQDHETKLSRVILLGVVMAQAIALYPELSSMGLRDNDLVSHAAMTKQMVQAMEQGGNPLDFWSPEVSLGMPMVRTYQPLAHFAVAATYFALAKTVPVMTLLVWAQFLCIVLLPVSFYAAMRLLEFPPLTAAAGALLAPLVAGPGTGLLGMELRSWLAFGVYPQAFATNLLLLAIGMCFQAIRNGTRVALAGAMLGLTCLAHLIFGWMGAWTAGLIALLPSPAASRALRIRRTAMVGAVALVLSAFQLVPLATDGYLLNRSRTDPVQKYDSVGAGPVLTWLFSGQILDYTRLPVLSLLALAGAALVLWRYRKTRKLAAAEMLALIASGFWVLVFFGRPTWGVLLLLLGATRDLHLHRILSAVQIFLLMLGAIGLAALWREAGKRGLAFAAALVTAVLLAPAFQERFAFVQFHESQGAETLAAVNSEGRALDQAIALAQQRGGRSYAGLPSTWGPGFHLGSTSVAAFLVLDLTPSASDAYNTSPLPADIMHRFDEVNPAQYRLFNIRTVLTPAVGSPPAFLKPVADFGRFRVLDAPGDGYFGLVDVAAAAAINRDNFYDLNDSWLHSDWPEKNQYIRLDFTGGAPKGLPRLSPGDPLPPVQAAASSPGAAANQRQAGQVYEADLDVARDSFALFRMAYHFCWKAYVDGASQPTAMLSPGYLGVPVSPGKHHILCRYEPGSWKVLMAGAGVLVTALLIAAEWVAGRKQVAARMAAEGTIG